MTNYAKKHSYILGVIIISVVAIGALIAGYRLQPNMTVSKNGILEVTLPLARTTVFVDDKKLITTETENQTVRLPLSINTHDVIIAREGYFPWMTQVITAPDTTSHINPILVTQNTTGQIITQKDPNYWTIRRKIQDTKIPTEANPRRGSKGSSVWVKDNTIYVKGAYTGGELGEREADVFAVITPIDQIRSLDFYKDRTDVIVFASDTGVYAIDAVENATEKVVNFYPLYKGIKPLFEKTENSFLYVLDGENLMMVVL